MKEFCAINVQTGYVRLYHVLGPKECWLQPHICKTFKAQMLKHGLTFDIGTMTDTKFLKTLRKDIDCDDDIVVASLPAAKTMERMGYENVEVLPPIAKWHELNKVPSMRCSYHERLPCLTCALKICWEMYTFCQPAFVPHFHMEMIGVGKPPIDAVYKYGEHSLEAPLYKSLSTVDLLSIAYPKPNGDRQHCMAGGHGQTVPIEEDCEEDSGEFTCS
jgi:hypothetical protein